MYVSKRLTFDDIRAAMLNVRLVEMDTCTSGITQDVDLLANALRRMNKFLAISRIKIWLEHNRTRLIKGKRGNLNAAEFLFLASNAENRINKVLELPTSLLTQKKQKISQTYHFDVALTHNRAPDKWLSLKEDVSDYNAIVKWDLDTDRANVKKA